MATVVVLSCSTEWWPVKSMFGHHNLHSLASSEALCQSQVLTGLMNLKQAFVFDRRYANSSPAPFGAVRSELHTWGCIVVYGLWVWCDVVWALPHCLFAFPHDVVQTSSLLLDWHWYLLLLLYEVSSRVQRSYSLVVSKWIAHWANYKASDKVTFNDSCFCRLSFSLLVNSPGWGRGALAEHAPDLGSLLAGKISSTYSQHIVLSRWEKWTCEHPIQNHKHLQSCLSPA